MTTIVAVYEYSLRFVRELLNFSNSTAFVHIIFGFVSIVSHFLFSRYIFSILTENYVLYSQRCRDGFEIAFNKCEGRLRNFWFEN